MVVIGIGIGDPCLKSSHPLNVRFFKIVFISGIGNGFSSWAGIEEVETGSCDLSSSKSLFTSKSGRFRDLSLFSISLYSRSDLSLSKSVCELGGLGIRDLLELKGVTLVREDEGDGVVGVVILVGEGDGGIERIDGGVGGGDRDGVVGGEVDGAVILVREGDGGGGPCGPGGITNPAGIFIPPAKLSLISFNNFITPSS